MSVRRRFPLSDLAKASLPALGKATSVFCVVVRASSHISRGPNLPAAGVFSLRVVLSLYVTHPRTGSRLIHHLRRDGTYHVYRLSDHLSPPNLLRWRESVTPVCLSPACVHIVRKAVYVSSKTGLMTAHLIAQVFDLVMRSLKPLIIITSVYFFPLHHFLSHFSVDRLC
jgi:hypothetical protein